MILCKLLLWFVITRLFETIIDSGIASLNGVKTHIYATLTNFLNTQNFLVDDSLLFVAQSARRWDGGFQLISSAGSMLVEAFFLHMTTRLEWLFFFFSLLLLIIFSSKSKSDSPSHENQQLNQAKQNTIEQPGYRP